MISQSNGCHKPEAYSFAPKVQNTCAHAYTILHRTKKCSSKNNNNKEKYYNKAQAHNINCEY